jgi:hypothetical protein
MWKGGCGMSKESTLASLAMLKVHIDSGKDYLEYLRPFVMQVLAYSGIEVITDASVGQKLKEDCGLFIPNRTIQIVLQRIVKAGYLKREHGSFVVKKTIDVKDYTVEKASAARNISAVTHALVRFAKDVSGRDISEEESVDALIVFLSEFSIPCLKSYLRGTALPNTEEHDDWKIVLVSQYISNIQQKEPGEFERFLVLVQGHMLANALLCPDLESVTKSYKGVVFYFDTPLLIQFLGLEGDAKKQAIDELINLVQQLDGKIAVLSHTIDELYSVINGSSDYIDSPKGRGSIVYEARRSGRTKSDMLLIAESASDELEAVGIQIKPTPAYENKFQIDETAFSGVLDDEVSYYNERARENDINSVRSIYVLRGGSCPHSIEKSGAVLVTNNSGFARAAYEYGKNIEQSREISPVITDFSLANTAWLKAPQGAPSLPQKEVIAFAYAALRPSEEFLQKVIAEAEKLEQKGKISARDHQLLRSSIHLQDELMSLTLGEDEALTEKSITETINKITEEIKREESEVLTAEQIAHTKTQTQLIAKREEGQEIQRRLYWRCDRRAKSLAKVVSFLLGAFLVIGIFASYYTQPISPVVSIVLTLGLGVLLLLTIGNLLLGTTVRGIHDSVKEKFRDWLFIREAKSLGISVDKNIKTTD